MHEVVRIQLNKVHRISRIHRGYRVERVDDIGHPLRLLQLNIGHLRQNFIKKRLGVVDHCYFVVLDLLNEHNLLILLLQSDLFILKRVVDLANLIIPSHH